ncbi:helix-turn-helix domain-containing protein [Nocardia carnea]|uniref:helix-turn-helix domain-containing protein n=1 Tax=Nocardia carnea TaxID=37328 RepID=UPI002453E6A7|nr:helix-turn-helix transcriptional regulator [Nocardia carnea]
MEAVVVWTGATVKLLRKARRMTQRQLAEAVVMDQRTVSTWECAVGTEVSAAGSAGLDRVLAAATWSEQNRFQALLEEHDMINRRQFGLAAALGLGATALPVTAGAGVTATAVEHLRTTVHAAMLLDDQLGSAAAQPIIAAHAQTCLALLRVCPAPLREAVQSLTAEAIGSQAWSLWDTGQYAESDRLFAVAYDHATAARSADVAIGLMCHRVQLALWTRRYQTAADLADATMRLPVHDSRTADYRSLQTAQAYAYAGRTREAWQLLDQISGDHVEPTTPDKSYVYYHSAWLTGFLSSRSLERAGESRAAVTTIETAIDKIPVTDTRDRALAHLHYAKLVAFEDLERACAAMVYSLELAKVNTSPQLREVYRDTRSLLAPWSKSRAVRELDAVAADMKV